MRKVVAAAIIVLLSAVTCVGHNQGSSVFFSNDYKIIRGGSTCNPDGDFPQMIIIPFFVHATQVVNDCDVYAKHKVGLALLIYYHKWVEEFGDPDFKVREMLEKVMIQWGDQVKISKRGFSIDGEPFTNRNIIGRVMGPSVIWVFKGRENKISETALVHELVHLSIRAEYGEHGDPDHEGGKYGGWSVVHTHMIQEVNQMLRAFNI
tara:strand:- start:3690 stop:4307 length:618 start_codon:yes stop_codon:yes gene_type:complete